MGLRIAVAFALAGGAVLALGTWLRSAARRRGAGIRPADAREGADGPGDVDGPEARSRPRRAQQHWMRRSAGIVLVATVPVGLAVAPHLTVRSAAVAIAAAGSAAFGLWRDRRDRRGVPRVLAVAVPVVVAVGLTAAGLRFPVAGVPVVDLCWSVAWLTLVAVAMAGSGNTDGQMPLLAGASVIGAVALAGFAVQAPAAVLLAAALGGFVAFLAFNLRPASLSMGRSGGAFAGVVVAAGALWARPDVGRPVSLVVPLLLAAVPLADGLLVVTHRLRWGRPLGVRARDHLVHRLVASGTRPGRAIGLVVSVQLVASVAAVLVGRGVTGPAIPAAVVAALLVVLIGLALRASPAYRSASRGDRIWLVVGGLVAFGVVATIPAVVLAVGVQARLSEARSQASDAIDAARAGDTDRAAQLFAAAEADFSSAHDRLGSVLTVPSLFVPVVGSNVHAARELSAVGAELSRAGRELAESIDAGDLRFVRGRVPLETVDEAEPRLRSASTTLRESRRRIHDVRRAYLVGPLRDSVRTLRQELTGATHDALVAAETAAIAPKVLGADGPQRYLLLVQNPAELRGTGGLIGNWGILTAENGTVHLDSLERVASLNQLGDPSARVLNAPADYVNRYERFDPARAFQSVNISPDFPTVAAVAADLYNQSSDQPVDGVMAVDPLGLAALLELTGPVRVPDWSVPITSANVVDVTLRDAYAAYARTPERADFLGDVARAAVDLATAGDLANIAQMSDVLGAAAHDGHLALWFADPAAERVVERIGISGKVDRSDGDSLLVATTNAGANKLDYFLRRSVDYSVTLTPSGDWTRALARSTVAVTLENTVPTSGVPQIQAGPYEGATDLFVYGQNHTYDSVYTPLTLTGAQVDGTEAGVEGDEELGRNVYSAYVDVFPQQRRTLALDLDGVVPLRRGGWYRLQLLRQPTLRADKVTVRVAVPAGYRILEARGLRVDDRVAQGEFDLTRARAVRVKIGVAGSDLWRRLERGAA